MGREWTYWLQKMLTNTVFFNAIFMCGDVDILVQHKCKDILIQE